MSHKICWKNQNTYCMFYTLFWKSCHVWDNVKKYCTVGQATNDNIIRSMCIECWITKATDTSTEYNGFANAPKCYIYEYIDCLISTLWHKILPEALSDGMTFADNACGQWTLLQQHQLHPGLAATKSTHITRINTENWIIYLFIYLFIYLLNNAVSSSDHTTLITRSRAHTFSKILGADRLVQRIFTEFLLWTPNCHCCKNRRHCKFNLIFYKRQCIPEVQVTYSIISLQSLKLIHSS